MVIELVSGPATLNAGVLTLDSVPGTVELRATQAGDSNWQAADEVLRTIEVVESADGVFEDRFEQGD